MIRSDEYKNNSIPMMKKFIWAKTLSVPLNARRPRCKDGKRAPYRQQKSRPAFMSGGFYFHDLCSSISFYADKDLVHRLSPTNDQRWYRKIRPALLTFHR